MEEAKPATPPSAQLVGNAFVEQYYQVLHHSPELVYKFYQDSSALSRTDITGSMLTVKTMDAIRMKIKSLKYEEYTAEIKTADAQESFEKGVIVLVTGCLTGKDNVGRKFTQTFFLAPQENGYFVLNDVFRYIEDIASPQANNVPVSIVDESAPLAASVAEPGDIVAQPLLDGVHIESSDIPEPSATLECHLSSWKKLLILDINGLLADIVQMEVSIPSNFKPDKIISRKAVFKRPFCDDFLQFCFDRFNVGVWSSRTKINVDIFIDYLLGDSKSRLLFCWNQSHCTSTRFKTEENKNKPLVLKELRKLWEHLVPGLPWARGEYNESNTLLLDDSPYKALRNPVNTAIFPVSYQFRNREDSSLGPGGDIRSYLEGLATAENVQKYVEQHPFGQQPITESNPSWNFYIEDDASPQANNVPVSIVDESAPLAASVTEPEPAQAPEPVVVEEPATVVPEDPILVVVDPSDIEEEPVIEDEVAIVEPPVPSIQSRDIPEVDPIPESQEDAPKKSYASIVKIMKSSVTSSPVRVVRPRTVSANTAHPSPGSVKPALPPVASTPSGDAAPESSDAHEEAEGHSIHVRNLPYDATVEQLEIEFKKFGLIKQDGIQVRSSKQQGFCFGFVEFESVTAMQNALQASPIKIGDRQAVIEEKRTTTKVSNDGRGRFSSGRAGFRSDSFRGGRGNYGGSRSFGRNEFRNQGEFSRSKSSVGRNEEGYQRANPNGRGGGRQGPANTRTSVPT